MSKDGSWNGSSDGPVRALARTGLLKLTVWLRMMKKCVIPSWSWRVASTWPGHADCVMGTLSFRNIHVRITSELFFVSSRTCGYIAWMLNESFWKQIRCLDFVGAFRFWRRKVPRGGMRNAWMWQCVRTETATKPRRVGGAQCWSSILFLSWQKQNTHIAKMFSMFERGMMLDTWCWLCR